MNMIRLEKLRDVVESLKNLKLDKDSIGLIVESLRDPDKVKKLKEDARNYLASDSGKWLVSIGTSLIIVSIVAPSQLSRRSGLQQILHLYETESTALVGLKENLDIRKKQLDEMKRIHIKVENLISNSDRIIFLPEVIRRVAETQGLEFISFRPISGEELSQFSNELGEDGYSDDFQDHNEFDESEMSPEIDDEFDHNQMPPEVNGDFESEGPQIKEQILEESVFRVSVEGDYLSTIRFIRELQGYTSYINILKISYLSKNNMETESNPFLHSKSGSTSTDLTIAVPIRSNQNSPLTRSDEFDFQE